MDGSRKGHFAKFFHGSLFANLLDYKRSQIVIVKWSVRKVTTSSERERVDVYIFLRADSPNPYQIQPCYPVQLLRHLSKESKDPQTLSDPLRQS